MVYQNPTSALNPTIHIGDQVAESFVLQGVDEDEAGDRAREMLERVQISDPSSVMQRYPHQLSGGMNQRVVIAMALAKDPTLLILDEPTTGLDATVEAEVLDLVSALRAEFKSSVLFISHSLDVILRMCDRVGVLYAGRLVEEGTAEEVFNNPRHPYAVGLLRCIPRAGARKDQGKLDTIPGFLPGLGAELPGCVFADRCGLVQDICHREEPPLHELGDGHLSRCHFHEKAQTLPRDTEPVAVDRREEGPQQRHPRDQHPQRAQDLPPGRPRGAGGGGHHLQPGARGDARPGRRVRQRQDHARAPAARAHPARRGLGGRARRRGGGGQDRQARTRGGARAADRLPEPRRGAQPPLLDPAHHRPGAAHAAGHQRQAARRRACATSLTRCASTCG